MPKSEHKDEKKKVTSEVETEAKKRLMLAQHATRDEAEKISKQSMFSPRTSEKKLEELNEHDLRNFVMILHKDMVTKKQYGYLDTTPDKIAAAISEKEHPFKDALQVKISKKVAQVIEDTNKAIAKLPSFNGDSDGTRESILLKDQNSKHIFVYALDKALKNGRSDGERIQIIYNQLKKYDKPGFAFNLKEACTAISVKPKLLENQESPKTESKEQRSRELR